MSGSFVATASSRIVSGAFSGITDVLLNIAVISWDVLLALLNVILPNRPVTKVVPHSCPGANGQWPRYVPPQEGDSRCSCPALNAMANHGILPHSGKNVSFRDLNTKVRETYNFAPSFCFFVPNTIANILCRNYWTDRFDLSDIDVHNGIEHDASLLREDIYFEPDQSKISVRLCQELLSSGTGENGAFTIPDLSRLLTKRRAESKAMNPTFSNSFQHKLFGSSNASTLLTIFGGKMDDIRPFLLEERLPEGWQPRIRHPFGLTIAEFNNTVLRVELGVKEGVAAEKVTGKQKAA